MQGEDTLSDSRLAWLRNQGRVVLGGLVSEVQSSSLNTASRIGRFVDNSYYEAYVTDNFGGQPILQIRIYPTGTPTFSEDIQLPSGIVWQFSSDTDVLFTAARNSGGLTFSAFSNIEDAGGLVTTSLAIPSYIGTLFPSKIEAGALDWQSEELGTISWDGPLSRGVVPIDSGLTTFGPNVYQAGKVLAEFPGYSVLGAALLDASTLVVIAMDSVAYRVLTKQLGTSDPPSIGSSVSRTQNGMDFLPRSPAFFNPSGTSAAVVLDNLDELDSNSKDEEAWVELRYSSGSLSLGGFSKPMSYEFSPKIRIQNSSSSNFSAFATSASNSTVTLVSSEFNDVSADAGVSWATPSDMRLVCVDYSPAGVEQRLEIKVMEPEADMSLSFTSSGTSASIHPLTTDPDEDPRYGVPGIQSDTAATTSTDYSLKITYPRLSLVLDGEEAWVSDPVILDEEFDALVVNNRFFRYDPTIVNPPDTPTLGFTEINNRRLSMEDGNAQYSRITHVDLRREFLATETAVRSSDRSQEENSTAVLPTSDAIAQPNFNFATFSGRVGGSSSGRASSTAASRKLKFIREDNADVESSGPGFNQVVTFPSVFTTRIRSDGIPPTSREPSSTSTFSDDVVDFQGLDTGLVQKTTTPNAINALTTGGRSSFIGSGIRRLATQNAQAAACFNRDFFVVLYSNSTIGFDNYTEYQIGDQSLEPIVFPTGAFAYSVKNV